MAMTKAEQEQFEVLLEEYRKDIPAFALDIFGYKLTPIQREFCDKFLNNKRISFKGGVGFGKTTVVAITIWWALFCLDDVKISVFGPTMDQVTNGVWNDLESLYNKLDPVFQDGFTYSQTQIARKKNGADCYAALRTVNKENVGSIAGLHAVNNFVFVDEAADVVDVAFDKVLVSHLISDINPKLVLVSNPRKASGYFYDTWRGEIADIWVGVHGRMQDGPNFKDEELITAAKQWGKGSNAWMINVEGDFPIDDADGLIASRLIDEAIDREDCIPSESRMKIWGVDPAGPGKDRSVILKRHDNVVFEEPIARQGMTITQLSYLVRDMFQALPRAEQAQTVIAVDANGLGRGLADNLKDFGLPVRAVTTQSSPTKGKDVYGNDKFAKLRDQLWWQVKEWFETEAVSIPYHKDLIRELKAPTYAYDGNGRVKVEGKTEMKKRLKVSPDFADALCLTFAVDEKRYAGKYSWSKPIGPSDLRMYE